MSHSVRPTPGWYADPSDSQLLRWWNGTEWSDHTQPMPSRPVLVQEAPQDAISVRNDLATAEPASPRPPTLCLRRQSRSQSGGAPGCGCSLWC